jgi:hypothetical protein
LPIVYAGPVEVHPLKYKELLEAIRLEEIVSYSDAGPKKPLNLFGLDAGRIAY